MDKKKINQLIITLESLDLISPIRNPRTMIIQERLSLVRCLNRNGYLAQYDTGIRYWILILLHSGFVVKPGKVHQGFRAAMIINGELSEAEAESIIHQRHRLKHFGVNHHIESEKNLLMIVGKMKEILGCL